MQKKNFFQKKTNLLPLLGPFFFSGGSLSLALLVQQTSSDPEIFASFAIIQLLLGASSNFINGLAIIPLTRLHATGALSNNELRFYLRVITIITPPYALIVSYLNSGAVDLSFFLLFFITLFYCLRWTLRGFSLAQGQRINPSISDFIFFTCTFAPCMALYLLSPSAYKYVLCIFLFAICFSMMPFTSQIAKVLKKTGGQRKRLFGKENTLSLATVMISDLGANAHSYLIAALLGTAAFAPIALANLLIRPIGVLLTAVVQMERSRIYKIALSEDRKLLRSYVFRINTSLSAALIAYSLVTLIIIFKFEPQVLRGQYALQEVVYCLTLVSLIFLMKIARDPAMEVVNAQRGYKSAAILTSFFTAIATSVVLLLIGYFGTALSALFGVLVAQTVFTIVVRVIYYKI